MVTDFSSPALGGKRLLGIPFHPGNSVSTVDVKQYRSKAMQELERLREMD